MKPFCGPGLRSVLLNDPFALEVPFGDGGQLNVFRSGGNLETALLISRARSAPICTVSPARWRELMSVREPDAESSKAWSDLKEGFASLKFRRLEGIDLSLVDRI